MAFLAIPKDASITRDTYDKSKSYDSVLWQKSKPVLDAELNEMQSILRDKLMSMLRVVGDVFVGNFLKIVESATTANNLKITAGDGVVEGLQAVLGADLEYIAQVGEEAFIRQFYWDSDVTVPVLTTPSGSDRTDLVVASFVMQEIDSTQDANLKDPNLNRETAIRWKVNIGIRVFENLDYATYQADPASYWAYENEGNVVRVPLAEIERLDGNANILTAMITDKREFVYNTESMLDQLSAQFAAYFTTNLASDSAIESWPTETIRQYVQDYVAGLDMQESVLDIQEDAVLDPGVTPTDKDRYILRDVAALHANFGTIDKEFDGSAGALADDDIVEYRTSWGEFRLVHPTNGFLIKVEDEGVYYTWTAGNRWHLFSLTQNLSELADVTFSKVVGNNGWAVAYDHGTGKFIPKEVGPPAAIEAHTVVYTGAATQAWHNVALASTKSNINYWICARQGTSLILPDVQNMTTTSVDVRFPTNATYEVLIFGVEIFTELGFLGLVDVDPTTYTGQARKTVRVNASEDKLEFGLVEGIRDIELSENLSANDLVKIINDGGTPKLAKVLGTVNEPSSLESVFKSETTSHINCVKLSTNRIVIAYSRADTYGAAVVAEISGNIITYGQETVFKSANSSFICCERLNENKVFIAFRGAAAGAIGEAVVGEIYGTDITFGTVVTFNATTSHSYTSCVALSENKVIIAYRYVSGSDIGASIVADIAGTVPTFGTAVTFVSGRPSYISCCRLSPLKALIVYSDTNNSSYGTSVVAEISGTVVTYGTPVVFNSANSSNVFCTPLSSTKVFISYTDVGNSSYGTGIIAEIAGTVVTYGTAVVFNTASTTLDVLIPCLTLASDKVYLAYKDDGNSNQGTGIIATIAGTVITYGSEVIFNAATTSFIFCTKISDEAVIVVYKDEGNTNYGTGVVINVDDRKDFTAVLTVTGTTGQTKEVVLKGRAYSNFSGLSIGKVYYIGLDGLKTVAKSNYTLGIALSATELLLD